MKTTKKNLLIVCTTILLCTLLMLAGCNFQKTPCTHDYKYVVVSEPTCSADGEKEGICSLCGNKIYQTIPSVEHQYAWDIVSQPTCENDGSAKGYCVFCGDGKTQILKATGHVFASADNSCIECGFFQRIFLDNDQKIGYSLEDIFDKLNYYGVYSNIDDMLSSLKNTNYYNISLNVFNHLTLENDSYFMNLGDIRQEFLLDYGYSENINRIEIDNLLNMNVIFVDGTLVQIGKIVKNPTLSTEIKYICVSKEGEFLVVFGDLSVNKYGKILPNDDIEISNELVFQEVNDHYIVRGTTNKQLQEVVIPPTHRGKPVKTISKYAFENCSQLQKVTIPTSITAIGSFAFQNCTSLSDIVIPNSVVSIGESAFAMCSNLQSIVIPDSVTTVGASAFSDCVNLSSVTLGKEMTIISSYMFYNCTKLTQMHFGSKMRSIGVYSFGNCSNLTEFYFEGSIATWTNLDVVFLSTDTPTNFIVYCQDGYITKYGEVIYY